MKKRRARDRRRGAVALPSAIVTTLCALSAAPMAMAAITIAQDSSTAWKIGNGNLDITYNPSLGNINSIATAAGKTNVLASGRTIYQQRTGTPFNPNNPGAVATSTGYTIGAGGSYIDMWSTWKSTPTTDTTARDYNPITHTFHYVLFDNDPTVQFYQVLDHSPTDPAAAVGQGQFLFRINPSLITHQYQRDTGPRNLGAQTFQQPNAGAAAALQTEGRKSQDATYDFAGSGIAGDFGTTFHTKYNFSTFTQLWKGQTEYGSQYALSAIVPSRESLNGGPTKQMLAFDNQIGMVEFLSGHYGDSTFNYVPPQGVATKKLFGPYAFRLTETNGKTGEQLYNEAIGSIPKYLAAYDKQETLIANGYVPSHRRGNVKVAISNAAGWSDNTVNNMVVLSDPRRNMQESSVGYQYWEQVAKDGTATLSNVVPGTYRMSIYQAGQWGETRVDGVTVQEQKTTIPAAPKFTPENFSTTPIWSMGTPNRSANEFLNGHNTNPTNGVPLGGDKRQYHGAYDYWKQQADLGNPGKVVYYATAVGAKPATNDPTKWIANQFQKFNPGLYNSASNKTDNYANLAPDYVKAAGGPATYTGSAWEVHFTLTSAQKSAGQYTILSVALAEAHSSLTVALNGGTGLTFRSAHGTNSAVRSGLSGYYQFVVFQFNSSALVAGADNKFTFSVSQSNGVMYDALRMEVSNKTADPRVTGWRDYTWLYGGTTVNVDDTAGLTLAQTFVPEPASVTSIALLAGALAVRRPARRKLLKS